ncbi:MAG TPA: transposase [Tepidiformaceae bacterium]|nr:transposase [Tepidiformaceae bacterium]HMO95911.1 transposase [Tepidiformaceae bacterium]
MSAVRGSDKTVGRDSPRSENPLLAEFEARRLRHQVVSITPAMRAVIERAIDEVCAHRNWALLALNVRSEHIHAVVTAPGCTPERVMNDFKSYSTRQMREPSLVSPSGRVWARHGSTSYLFEEDDVAMAVDYTLNHQGARMPGSWWTPPRGET